MFNFLHQLVAKVSAVCSEQVVNTVHSVYYMKTAETESEKRGEKRGEILKSKLNNVPFPPISR